MELLLVISCFLLSLFIFSLVFAERRRCRLGRCYLLDYVCHKPDDDRKLSTFKCAKVARRNARIGLPEFKFLLKMAVSSGVGESTYSPRNILEGREEDPPHDDALAEMDDVWQESLDKLFAKTGVSPRDIDVLVLNVSMFFPTPSLTARIVNHYRMREDVLSYNLSGMGCSSSVIAIGLVQNIFKIHPRLLAIVVSSESICPNWYTGRVRSMMLGNALFRSGGASILLTNDLALAPRAKMELKCLLRVHTGADDMSYRCADWKEDDDGIRGIFLDRTLPTVAMKAFTENLRHLAPKILPVSELARYAFLSLIYHLCPSDSNKPAINVKAGANHFIIHAGGLALIRGVEKSLRLSEYDVEPAKMTLHRWGNVSSASLWYELCYMEAKKRLRKGNRVLMFGLGGGFKCNSCLWEVKRDVCDGGAWADCIDDYPAPKTLQNPFAKDFGWIYDMDDGADFGKFMDHYLQTGEISAIKAKP